MLVRRNGIVWTTLRLSALYPLTACGAPVSKGDGPITIPPDCLVVSVSVSPASLTMHPRDTTVLHGGGANQCLDHRVTVQWRLSDSTVATIASSTDSTAVLVARAAGATTVFAAAVQDPTVRGASLISIVP